MIHQVDDKSNTFVERCRLEQMEKIVIIGAGPAGLMLAHYLLPRGRYRIEIYEQRSDPRLIPQANQRTFPLSLQTRGLNAIQAIPGLEAAVSEHGVWSRGASIHRKRGHARVIERSTPQLMIDRNQLSLTLLQRLLASDLKQFLNVQFNCVCTAVDLSQNLVTLQPATGSTFSVKYDRLIAADGVNSRVRSALVAQGAMRCLTSLVPDSYKSFQVHCSNTDDRLNLATDYIHTWTLNQGVRVIAAPQPHGWLHGVFIYPNHQDPLARLNFTAAKAFFEEQCPTLASLLTPAAIATLQQQPGVQVTTVKCDRMHIDERILLIGDAAHAVSPSIGQGCNSALQDAQIFAKLLNKYRDEWEFALPAFTAQRLPDAHALQDLSDYTFPRSKRLMLEFILRLTLGKWLRRWLPKQIKPLPTELLMEGDMSYSEVLYKTQGWINRVKRSHP